MQSAEPSLLDRGHVDQKKFPFCCLGISCSVPWERPRSISIQIHRIGLIRQTVMPIYLFRAGSSRTFAYSLDVTGRNIRPVPEQAKWRFETTVDAEQFEAHPEALQRIWEDGFYVFTSSGRPRGNR
jgi:hypothetical protein